jgi:seryl-tRNA synthetase
MIDLKAIRDEPARIRSELKARGSKLKVDDLVKLDAERRKLQTDYDELRARQKETRDPAEGGKLKARLNKIEERQKTVEADFRELYLQVPNFHHESAPIGPDESGNKVVKVVGKKPALKDPKPHYEIPAIKPLIDFERGAKVSGSRFWYLKGELVDLEFAVIRYALDFYEAKGFTPMRPPSIVNREAMEGTGFFPTDANEIYNVGSEPDEDAKYLSGTAEVPLAAYHADEQLDPAELPIKYVGFAPAYRREAGSYGKDTKGILRGHEFDKLELFIFAAPEDSWKLHEQLQADAEEFWTSLGIPFQVLNMCTGDIGAPNAKKYDLEAWLPGEGKYREVASNSNDTDFQARRLKIKSGGQLVHTLNNTAAAVGRTIIAIVENYQTAEGDVEMPKVLHKYLPFKRIEKGD